ncbi:MAG: hypothetical protein M3N04_06020 [Actinomycetota bacterium]|nr:hypothetical protein [Actinomycetota bacterium]
MTKIEAASRGIACRADVLWCDPVDQRIRRQYTCRAGTPKNDCDVYTIADGKDDSKPLARIGAKGRIKTLKGQITRFTEGRAREDRSPEAHARRTHHRSATKRVVRGTMRVHSGTCPGPQSATAPDWATLRSPVVRDARRP